jgi:hypothetical protein
MARYYQGDPDKQPKDCGRKHPQPLCLCVMCEIANRFDNIAKLNRSRELLRAVKALTELTPKTSTTPGPICHCTDKDCPQPH